MERRCNVLTIVSVIYSLYVCTETQSFSSITSFTFEILVFQCLFLLLVTHGVGGLSNQSKYRPCVKPNLMCLLMVPLCLISDIFMAGSDLGLTTGSDLELSRFDDMQVSLGITAVILTKYFFLLGKNKSTAVAVLTATTGYILVFANSGTFIMFVLSSLLLWKMINWIPEVTPRSFSFAEMGICLQLALWFLTRTFRELSKMQHVDDNESRLKWIGATAVIAVSLATLVIWMMKVWLSTLTLLSFVCVYGVFAVASLGLLTWVTQDNLLWWFLQLMQGDCTLKKLLLSWVLFFTITVLWTVSHAFQISLWKRRHKFSIIPKYAMERQDRGEDKFETFRHRGNDSTSDDETKPHYEKVSKSRVSFHTRKVFHLFILFVYVPGLFIAPDFLRLASCLAFGVFIIVEAARVLHVPGLGAHLDKILRTFVDERDQGVLFLTHFYLLIGLSLPLWITHSSLADVSPIKLYSGVLSLGIGDTVACVAGRAFGRHKWRGTEKTVEGTLSSIVAQLGFIYICSYSGDDSVNDYASYVGDDSVNDYASYVGDDSVNDYASYVGDDSVNDYASYVGDDSVNDYASYVGDDSVNDYASYVGDDSVNDYASYVGDDSVNDYASYVGDDSVNDYASYVGDDSVNDYASYVGDDSVNDYASYVGDDSVNDYASYVGDDSVNDYASYVGDDSVNDYASYVGDDSVNDYASYVGDDSVNDYASYVGDDSVNDYASYVGDDSVNDYASYVGDDSVNDYASYVGDDSNDYNT